MIPKIIHYCWLSNDPIPDDLKKCMDSWKEKLPDYEVMLWNFDRFPKTKFQWVSDAFDNKKYAFAADYIRLNALYNYGGIYLDMDVEVLKCFDPLLELHTFVCWQKEMSGLEVAAFGSEKHAEWLKDCLSYYKNRPFIKNDGSFDTKVLPTIVEDELRNHGYDLVNCSSLTEAKMIENTHKIPVFPCEYFSPKSYKTGKIEVTDNSYSIHHFAGSWLEVPKYEEIETKFWKLFGLKNLNIINKIIWRFK